jgi:lipoprotein-releasing system permease protein
MTVVLSVINGFEVELKNRFLAANAHILAFNFPGGLAKPDVWAEKIRKDFGQHLTGMSRFVHYETMARKNSLLHSTLIRGIEPKERQSVQDLRPLVRPPEALDELQRELESGKKDKLTASPIILGRGLLSLLNAKIGDTIQMVAPDAERVGDMQAFKIVGVYDSGLSHYDNKLGIVSLSAAQAFFHMGTRVTGLEIGLKKPDKSPQIAEQMNDKYTIQIKEWQSFNRSLFEAMQIERAVIALIVFLVSGVASFNILTTLFISVTQKQRSISILKALGATNREILLIFLIQGAWVGIIGTAAGSALAVGISMLIEKYQFIDLPEVYMLASLPMNYDWRTYAIVGGGAVVVSLVAGLYPAWIASRMPPTLGIKGLPEAAPAN